MAPKSPFPEFIPLTEDELQSLHCISMVDTSKVIAAAHIEKLMKVGYVRDGTSRPLSNNLGLLRLIHERNKKAAPK